MNEEEVNALFKFTSGPRTARVLLVGEAWGATEAVAKRPFAGSSGHELDRMLQEAQLSRSDVLCANVISVQPPGNDFTHFLLDNKEGKKSGKSFHGTYPKPDLYSSIDRLYSLINHVQPEVIIAAGNWPLHVLTPHAGTATKKGYKLPTGITSWRGSQTYTREIHGKKYKCLPIIHPAAILREWSYRSTTVHDLRSRLGRHLNGTLAWDAPPTNAIWRPSFSAVDACLNAWISIACHRELWLSVDIETYRHKYISCIGLCDADLELCIPFFSFTGGKCIDYFSLREEVYIWSRLKTLLEHPNVKIIGQNFIYDTQYLKRAANIEAIVAFDTMVAHHLLFPGTPKGLHNLASLYCNHYCYWKDEGGDWKEDEFSAEDLWKYNCKDIRTTYEIAKELKQIIVQQALDQQLQQRLEEWKLARSMTLRGIAYDDKVRKEFQQDTFKQVSRLESWLLSAMPEAFKFSSTGTPWYNSPTHAAYVLYDRLGIKPILHKKTKRPTLDDNAINELTERRELKYLAPLLERLSSLRSAQVFKSHFLDVKLGPSGRLHSQFNIAHPETFRWSSAENAFGEGTNLQNTPKVED